jgi:eukaryotic-like serine/threonine-protein kinase
LLRQTEHAKAEPFLRESLAIREQHLGDDWRRFNALSMLGEALLGQQKFAEAEPKVIEGYQGLKTREPRIPATRPNRLAEAATRIVKLYEAWGKLDKATEWRKTLETPTGPR